MTALATVSQSPAPSVAEPADLLLPQLQWRSGPTHQLGDPAFLRAAASIALSRDLNAVLTRDGVPQSPADLGRRGLSIRSAWDDSAANLLKLANTEEGLRVWIRPRGESAFEVAVEGASATRWLAHPRTFTLLNGHLTRRVGASPRYLIPTATAATFFVSAAEESTDLRGFDEAGSCDVVYSAGFPVPADQADRALPGSAASPLLLVP